MGNALIIPIGERSPGLREFLFAQANAVSRMRQDYPVLLPDHATPLLLLCYPWMVEPVGVIAERRGQIEAAGFDASGVLRQVDAILREDRHLRECCPTPGHLIPLFDLGFIAPAIRLIGANTGEDQLVRLYEEFCSFVYQQGRFKSIALSHLFNFAADDASLEFGEVRIVKLEGATIAQLLGEASAQSFLHPPGCGDYFVVSEAEGPTDDMVSWLFD